MLNGIEDAQTCVAAVARQQDHFNVGRLIVVVEVQQLLYQPESHAGFQNLVLASDLVTCVGVEPLSLKHAVTLVQIEQRP